MQEEDEQKKKQKEADRKRRDETFIRAKKFLREYFDKLAREQKNEVEVNE
jgi:hypothetical protein